MGTVPSAAGGRLSEVQGVAAVEIFTRKCIKISGTATGHNGAAPFRAIKSCYIPKGINKYMVTYRSGHNGAHSKCVCGQPHESSNLSVTANKRFELGTSEERKTVRWTVLVPACVSVASGSAVGESLRHRQQKRPSFHLAFFN